MADNLTPKKEMPESIRKMFEQRAIKTGSNLSMQSPVVKNNSAEEKPLISEEISISSNFPDVKKEKKRKENKKTAKEKVVKEKVVKEKVVKEKKDKKPLTKKAKIIISLVVAGLVIAGAVVGLVLYLASANKKMQTPVVEVYALSNQTIVRVEEDARAKSYEFYIQKDGVNKISIITSQINEVSIKSYLSAPAQYKIWAKCVGSNSSTTSNESTKITYKYYNKLDTPLVSISYDSETHLPVKLNWNPVVNAKEYRVYYGASTDGAKYLVVPKTSDAGVISFNLDKIDDIGAGSYTLNVVAVADADSYYKDSELGESITYISTVKLNSVLSATFNKTTNILKFVVDTTLTATIKFQIIINNNQIMQGFTATKIQENYEIDLTPYLNGTTTINSMSIVAVGDGIYTQNSDARIVGII